MPLFIALANTSLVIPKDWYHALVTTNSLGIIMGLVLGKPIGIVSFSYLAMKLKLISIPKINFIHVTGVGLLGGIGFTMSIFITLLAFGEGEVVEQSKMAVMIGSVIAGVMGFAVLKGSNVENSSEYDGKDG